jgi:hypothetical protein
MKAAQTFIARMQQTQLFAGHNQQISLCEIRAQTDSGGAKKKV